MLAQDLESKHTSDFDWPVEIDSLFDLAQLAGTFSNRFKKLATTNEILLRLLLRHLVLPKLNPLLTELRLYDVGLISDVFLGSLYIPELQQNHIIPVPLTVQIWRRGLKKRFCQNFIRI